MKDIVHILYTCRIGYSHLRHTVVLLNKPVGVFLHARYFERFLLFDNCLNFKLDVRRFNFYNNNLVIGSTYNTVIKYNQMP